MCTYCSALWLVPPITMVLILTARSSPHKGRICFPCSGAVVERAGWGMLRHHQTPRPSLARCAAQDKGGPGEGQRHMCELWLQPHHLLTVLHPAAGKGRKSAPCSGRARLDTASSCPCTQHMPCWYPNLGDGAASALHSASTADPSPQARSDTNRHCHDGGEIKRVGEAQFPPTSASFSPTLKAREPACPQDLSLTCPTNMELLQSQLPQLRAWAASCGHVRLELAVTSCSGGRVPWPRTTQGEEKCYHHPPRASC